MTPPFGFIRKTHQKVLFFGTDKETNGGIYAFDLEGNIIEEKSIKNIERPNNVDLEYGFQLNDSVAVDVIAFTEREKATDQIVLGTGHATIGRGRLSGF